jgi:hypothetical protein
MRTELKVLHGRSCSIIRDTLHNTETWAAVGAVCKGIGKAPVLGVRDIAETIITESTIRWDKGATGMGIHTAENTELRKPF